MRPTILFLVIAACGASTPEVARAALTNGSIIKVGDGTSESPSRQVLRAPNGYVYIVVANDRNYVGTTPMSLTMYRANEKGTPTTPNWQRMDAAHETTAPMTNANVFSGGDARIGSDGIIHVAFERTGTAPEGVLYREFNTNTNLWGAPAELVKAASAPGNSNIGSRGWVPAAIALSTSGTVWVAAAELYGFAVYRRTGAGAWVVDLPPVGGNGQFASHAGLALDRQGRLHASWVQSDDQGSSGTPKLQYALRSAAGVWSTPLALVSGNPNLLNDQTRDVTAAIAYDSHDRPCVLYNSGTPGDASGNPARMKCQDATGAWVSDDPMAGCHAPGLYFSSSDDKYVGLGHDASRNPSYLSKPLGGTWSSVYEFLPLGPHDGSASIRWDPLYDLAPGVIDIAFYDETTAPETLYYASIAIGSPPPQDMSVPLDMTQPRDLAKPLDSSTPPDLAKPLDMTPAPDLALPPCPYACTPVTT